MTPSNPGDERPTLMQEFDFVLSTRQRAGKRPIPAAVEQSPVLARELIALLLMIVLADLTLYRGRGYAGIAVLLTVVPLLLLAGIVRRQFDGSGWILAPLLALTSIRLVWCGSVPAVIAGCVLLCGYAMGLAGMRPHVLPGIVFASHLISAGHRGLRYYASRLARFRLNIPVTKWIALLLPLATLVVFSTIFVLANPDLVKSFSSGLTRTVEFLQAWLANFELLEILFCLGIGWIGVGLLRPDVRQVTADEDTVSVSIDDSPAALYEAFRNSLVVVIGLFAAYLIFEFQTLWFRVFPKGFHYSGYAHEGAAWLTVALGLATLLLSAIFRGQILGDPRLGRLRVLSWIWSIENLLLAISVFNRLFIYVGFNGMTRMRVIGLLGVASVVGGFALVLMKIWRNHDFNWLIRRQLWVVTFAAYLYAVLPVDAYVNTYNVRRILAGDPAPSVQISVHPTSAEGWLCLEPLIDCDDSIIRGGIRALLQEQLTLAEHRAERRAEQGWTAIQVADDVLLNQLRRLKPQLESEGDTARTVANLATFRQYAYQWY